VSIDPTVEIFCDDTSHEGRRWVVAVLVRGDEHWHPEHVEGRRLSHTGSVVQFLATPGSVGPARVRYNFRCELCGRCVTSRGEKMIPVLDTLGAAGRTSISLHGLAAIL
jgi:hypothetical protein